MTDPLAAAEAAYKDACVAYAEKFDHMGRRIGDADGAYQKVVLQRNALHLARHAAARASEDEEILKIMMSTNWPCHVSPDRAREILIALKAAGFDVRQATKP